MDKLKNVFRPGHKHDDNRMYRTEDAADNLNDKKDYNVIANQLESSSGQSGAAASNPNQLPQLEPFQALDDSPSVTADEKLDPTSSTAPAASQPTTSQSIPVTSNYTTTDLSATTGPAARDESEHIPASSTAATRGHSTQDSQSSIHRSVWPANNDPRTSAATANDDLARKEALNRDKAAADRAAVESPASKNQSDIASATYTYTSHRVGGSTSSAKMDSTLPHVPGEFPTDDGDDVHGVQQEVPISSTTTAPTLDSTVQQLSTVNDTDHTARNTVIGAGSAEAGAAGLHATAGETTKLTAGQSTAPVSNLPSLGNTVTLPDRTVGAVHPERQTHPSGLGTTIGNGTVIGSTEPGYINPVSSNPTTTQTDSASSDHTGRNVALGAGAGAIGAGAVGAGLATRGNDTPQVTDTSTSDPNWPLKPGHGSVLGAGVVGATSNDLSNISYMNAQPRSSTDEPVYTGTKVSNIQRTIINPESQSSDSAGKDTSAGIATSDTAANSQQDSHLGRNTAIAGATGAGVAGAGAAAYESNKSSRFEESFGSSAGQSRAQPPTATLPGQAAAQQSTNNAPIPSTAVPAAATSSAPVHPVDRHQHSSAQPAPVAAGVASSNVPPQASSEQQHNYGRDAAVAGGAGAVGAGGVYAATQGQQTAGPHSTQTANALDPRVDSQAQHATQQQAPQQTPVTHSQPAQAAQPSQQHSSTQHHKEKETTPVPTAVSPEKSRNQTLAASDEVPRSSHDSSSNNVNTPSTPTRSSADHHRRLHKKSDPRGPTTPEILRQKRERGQSLGQGSARGASAEQERVHSHGSGSGSGEPDHGHHPAQSSEGQWLGQGETNLAEPQGPSSTGAAGQKVENGEDPEWEEVEGEGGQKIRKKKPSLLKKLFHPGGAKGEETTTS